MDFSVEKSDLLKELAFVRSAVEKRATIPVLSHFLLEADGFELKISATDLDIAAGTACPAKVKTKGSAVLPGLRFLDLVRSAPEGQVRCRALERDWVNVTYGRSSFKLVGLPKDDFPRLPRVPPLIAKVDGAVLADCVEKTFFATSAALGAAAALGRQTVRASAQRLLRLPGPHLQPAWRAAARPRADCRGAHRVGHVGFAAGSAPAPSAAR